MKRSEFSKKVGLGAAAMPFSSLIKGGSLNRNTPNVLIIAIDDLNDWVGCMGEKPVSKRPI